MKSDRHIAEYYDLENARCGMLPHDVPFFLSHLPKRRQRILELAAGTGRAAIPLAQAGHQVVGVDFSPDMLAVARRKASAVGLAAPALRLVQQDVLSLKLTERFDYACVFFNTFLTFTTLTDQERLLANVRRHLKPHGRLWLDIFYPNFDLLAPATSHDLEPDVFHVPHLDRTVFRSTSVRRGKTPQLQLLTFHYRWFDAVGREHHERSEFNLTFFFPRELLLLLDRHRFKIIQQYGDYDGSPVTPASSRIITLCQAV